MPYKAPNPLSCLGRRTHPKALRAVECLGSHPFPDTVLGPYLRVPRLSECHHWTAQTGVGPAAMQLEPGVFIHVFGNLTLLNPLEFDWRVEAAENDFFSCGRHRRIIPVIACGNHGCDLLQLTE